MKTLLLIICLMMANFCFSQCDTTDNLSQKDSLVRAFFKNLKNDSYKGEKIGDVLKKDTIKEYCRYSYIQKIVGVFSGVQLHYKGFITLRLHVSQKECSGFGRSAAKWDFEKIKNCKVGRIEVLDFIDLR